MKSLSKGNFKVAVLLLGAICFIAQDLAAHGGRWRGPSTKSAVDTDPNSNKTTVQGASEKGISYPGGGPQIPFDSARWEFWWDYNHEPLVGLKTALYNLTPQAGAIDFPFEKVTPKSKKQLVRLFTKIFREDSSARVREAALMSLARTHDDSVLPWLQIALEDDNLYVRTMAVIALGISQIEGAVPVLQAIFEDKNESTEIRSYSAVAVGLAGGQPAVELFKYWLDPKVFKGLDKALQETVAFGAGLTEDPTLGPHIRTALIDNFTDDRITNSYLVLSLGRLGDRAANAILLEYMDARDTQVRRSAVVALGASASPSDKDVIQGLIDKIDNDSDNIMKNFCYISLGKIGGETAEEFLEEQLESVKRAYLPYVGLALGLTRNPKYGKKLFTKFMAVRDLTTRGALAVAMGLVNYRDAIGEFRKIVDNGGEPIFSGYCALTLGLLRDSESVERILKLYQESNDVELQGNAARALGLIGDLSVTSELYKLLDRSTPDITRLSTAYNLGLIGDQKAIEPLTRVATNKNENERFRSYALLGLGMLGDDRESPVVSKISRNNNYTILDNFLSELMNVN